MLTVKGNLILSSSSSVTSEDLGGTPASGQFGQLAVQKQASLGGTFAIAMVNGFGPLTGQAFNVASYASSTGAFSSIQGQTVGGANLFTVAVNAAGIVVTAASTAADLSPTSVTIAPTALVGQPTTISYTVSNLQAAATLASAWTDSVYLSTDGTIDASSILLGTVTHSGAVVGHGAYSASLIVPTPAVLPGDYQVVVLVDSGDQAPDSNRGNNVLASTGSVAINYQSISQGNPAVATVQAGQDLYYRIDVPTGSDAMLTATLGQAGAAQIYASDVGIPTAASYQQTAVASGTTLAFPLLDTGASPYFLLVRGLNSAGSGQSLILSMRYLGFEIVAISPAVTPASGTANVTITGSHFTSNTTAGLVAQSGFIIAPASITFDNSNTLWASFDLTGVVPGAYNVKISDSGKSFTDPLAFQVVVPQTLVSGTLSANAEWLSGMVYHVTSSVTVPSGVTLTIDPGAIVKFEAGCGMTVQSGGQLIADGTVAQPIVFTSIHDNSFGGDTDGSGNATPPAPGDWGQNPRSGLGRFRPRAGALRQRGRQHGADQRRHSQLRGDCDLRRQHDRPGVL